ncbi:ACP S-malonyltransferase [Actinacidiphila oryziradicis]|uniref:ACP S-malonyltransferase n=1 Tax=Actinacidiphila oryziradicis TaxID=2571141 RepID=UPI00145FA910|nr:ACP S-malonyltransferase [Actinacidiphila oryziradicis]
MSRRVIQTPPGVAFPGQAVDRRAVDILLDAHRHTPLVTELFGRLGVTGAGQIDFADTRAGQPCTYAAGLLSAWQQFGTGADHPVTLGHSLGEMTSLVYAGALDPLQGLDLLFELGEVGHEQDLRRPSRLVVLMGLDLSEVDRVCRLAVVETGAVLEPSGFNGPTQTILCGDAKAAQVAADLARARGATVRLLPIRGAYHCSLMTELLPRWQFAVGRMEFRTPRIPVVSSVDGRCRVTADGLMELLTRWLLLPVRWSDAVTAARDAGATALVDAGPGEILRDISRRGSALAFVRTSEMETS